MMNDRMAAIGRGEVDPLTGRVPAAGGAGRGRRRLRRARRRAWRSRRPGWRRRARRPARPVRPRLVPAAQAVPVARAGSAAAAFSRIRTQFTRQLHLRRLGARQRALSVAARHASVDSGRTRGTTSAARVGGPVRIPKVYNGTRRTNFQFTYSGNQSDNLFDQYATVPTDAVRAGDFSSACSSRSSIRRRDCRSPTIVIPANRISPGARVLLDYMPQANLPGTTRNFHYSTTTDPRLQQRERARHAQLQRAAARARVVAAPAAAERPADAVAADRRAAPVRAVRAAAAIRARRST